MKRLWCLATFQILTIGIWASYHEYVWVTAPVFKVPLQPRDPFDLIRGRYFILNPQDAVISSGSTRIPNQDVEQLLASKDYFSGRVQVGFCPDGAVYRACGVSRPGEGGANSTSFQSRAFATIERNGTGWHMRLDLGLRRFFIPNRLQLPALENQEGWELEVSYRQGLTLLPRRLLFKGTALDVR